MLHTSRKKGEGWRDGSAIKYKKEGREEKLAGVEGTEYRDLRSVPILEMAPGLASDGMEREETP